MVEEIKDIFRRKGLKKHASQVPTALTPIKQVRSAVAFIDVSDTSFDACKMAIQSFYRDNDIKGDIFFFDFRKIGKGERLITSIQTTVLLKDLNWFGKPSEEKIGLMLGSNPDLFISLINNNEYPIEFMANCSQAKFKIGRKQLPNGVFDLVISDPPEKELSQLDSFKAIRAFLNKIS